MSNTPQITVSELDLSRLEELLEAMPANTFPGKSALEAELARATVIALEDMPPTVITMNSTVRFRIDESSEAFSLRLVYPKDVDPAGGTISIFAPVGSALLGLSEGDEIEWPRPGGGMLQVRIEEVTYQPERSGLHNR